MSFSQSLGKPGKSKPREPALRSYQVPVLEVESKARVKALNQNWDTAELWVNMLEQIKVTDTLAVKVPGEFLVTSVGPSLAVLLQVCSGLRYFTIQSRIKYRVERARSTT